MRYTLEIPHFPGFFHEMSVPEGNATCNAENKHGGLELSKRKRKDVQNSTDCQRMKVARVNKHKWSYFA